MCEKVSSERAVEKGCEVQVVTVFLPVYSLSSLISTVGACQF